jgi:hypothetical protein
MLMKFLSVLTILIFASIAFAQKAEDCACSKKDKAKIKQYFAELDKQNRFIADCEQKKMNNRKLISGRCEWGGSGCPASLVKPEFPSTAKKLKIFGNVKVEIIVDETGSVIYANMIEGNKVFKKSSERAACKSRFTSFRFCDEPVKYKTVIEFSFVS